MVYKFRLKLGLAGISSKETKPLKEIVTQQYLW